MRKVRWRNGAVVGEEHLVALESWVEDLCAFGLARRGDHGLLRSEGEVQANAAGSISLHENPAAPARLDVELSDVQGLTPSGHLVLVRRARMPLELGGVPGSTPLLYLEPLETGEEDPADELATYEPPVRATCLPGDASRVLAVARLRLHHKPAQIDPDYVAPCAHIGGCAASAALHARFVERLEAFDAALGDAHLRLLELTAASAKSRAALELVRCLRASAAAARPVLADASMPTSLWSRRADDLLDRVDTEARRFLPELAEPARDAREAARGDLGSELRRLLARLDAVATALAGPLGAEHVLADLRVADRRLERAGVAWRTTIELERALSESLAPTDALSVRLRFRRPPVKGEVARVHPSASYHDVPEADRHPLLRRAGDERSCELRFRPGALARRHEQLTFFTETEPDIESVEIARMPS